MGQYASVRRKRKNIAISSSSAAFSSCLEKKDYESAAKIAFWTALKVGGKEELMNALDNANSFIRRKKMRRGL